MKKKKGLKKQVIAISTVAALILGIVSYTKYTINAEVDKVPVIFTTKEIAPRTEIKESMVSVRYVPSQGVPPNAIRSPKQVIGKWTVSGFGASKNSMLYKEKISKKDDLPDSSILSLKKGEVAFPLLVDLETSLGNSIIPNSNVDLYFRSKKQDGASQAGMAVIYGKLASQIRVVAVKDAQATNVFQTEGVEKEEEAEQTPNGQQQRTLASIYIFAVPEEVSVLLNKAKLVGDVVPVATSEAYTPNKKTEQLSESEVVQFINGVYDDLDKEEIEEAGATEEGKG